MFETPTLLDGGFSTALESLGKTLNTSLWSGELLKSDPEAIRAGHKLFVDAGAEILITSSYQISYPGCEARGWSRGEVDEALALSTELARFPGIKVAASVGPYGAYLADGSEYRGNYGLTQDELKDFHRERLRQLLATNPDLVAIETIPEITEAQAIINLLDELESSIPAWISFSCRSESEISSGESFAEAVSIVSKSPHLLAIGVNCTAPENVTSLLASATSEIPFVVYPNSGRQWDAEKKVWLGDSGSGFSPEQVREWKRNGAVGIGGCCGVGPNEIGVLRSLVKESL